MFSSQLSAVRWNVVRTNQVVLRNLNGSNFKKAVMAKMWPERAMRGPLTEGPVSD